MKILKWKTPEDILNGANFHRIHGPDVKWTPGKASFIGICSLHPSDSHFRPGLENHSELWEKRSKTHTKNHVQKCE